MKDSSPAQLKASSPLWLRCVAAFCLLLLSVASTAQAAHVHSGWGAPKAAKAHGPSILQSSDGGEEHCQLCQAMHSALPASGSAVPALFPAVLLADADVAVHCAKTQLLLAMFSRPPPVSETV